MLGTGRQLDAESSNITYDVARHGHIDVPLIVIPLQCRSEVNGVGSVDGCRVFCVQGLVEVVEICSGCRTDTKIIDEKGESGRFRHVCV